MEMDILIEAGKVLLVYVLAYFAYDTVFRSLLIPLYDPDGFGLNKRGLYKTAVTFYCGAVAILLFTLWLMDTRWGLAIAAAPTLFFTFTSLPYYYTLLQRIKAAYRY
jgi:hypothetical protein